VTREDELNRPWIAGLERTVASAVRRTGGLTDMPTGDSQTTQEGLRLVTG
jgi:hypothetical protein